MQIFVTPDRAVEIVQSCLDLVLGSCYFLYLCVRVVEKATLRAVSADFGRRAEYCGWTPRSVSVEVLVVGAIALSASYLVYY